MFDFALFFEAAGATTPIVLPVVLGLVQWFGKLGVSGRWQLVTSMLTGLVLGVSVMYFQLVPELMVEWFACGLYGLVVGLTASGVYEVGKELVTKANKEK